MDIFKLRWRIRQEQQARNQQEERLMESGATMPGSLLVRYAHRGRITTSKNQRGLKGPYYFISNKGRHRYVHAGQLERVSQLLGNHKSFKKGLQMIHLDNQRIRTLLKQLWRQRMREGRR